MSPSASDRAPGSRARCRSFAAILGAVLLSTVAATAAPAKTPPERDMAQGAIVPLGSQSPSTAPAGAGREFVPGELIVRFKPGAMRSQARRDEGAKLERELTGVDDLELLRLERGTDPEAAAQDFERRSDVLYAEPNYVITPQATTNDTRLGEYWGHNNTGQVVDGVAGTADADMDVFEAWNITQSSPSVLVAVLDSGIAYDHPDLAPSMWANPGETCTSALPNRCRDGVDNDGNGVPDDVRGYDFADQDSDPRDVGGHGTHVAGTIAARGNNDVAGPGATDGTGVSTQAKLIAVKVFGDDGSGNVATLTEAIAYAGKRGAKVANLSLGGSGFSQANSDAFKAAPNTLFVVAAGNGGADGVGDDNDTTPQYPCNYSAPTNIVCVAATDQHDQFTGFSNYGATSVDVAAPGENILSMWPAFRTVLTDTFETNPITTGRWTRGGTPNTWHWTDLMATEQGGHSLTDSPGSGVDYKPNTNNWIRRTSPLDLSTKSACKLEFVTLVDTELNRDYLLVDLATALGSEDDWKLIWGYSGLANGLGTGSLDGPWGKFSGKPNVYLRFGLESDAANESDGAYVDDLRIKCVSHTGYNAGDFNIINGTSMATPNVAGVAALMYARFPTLSIAQGRTRLLQSVDAKAALNQPGKRIATGGRLNAYKVLAQTSAGVTNGTLNITAGKGVANALQITQFTEGGIAKYRVADPYGAAGTTGSRVFPSTGCVADGPYASKCNASAITRVNVVTDDMDDTVSAGTLTIPVTVDGGAGNDTITTGSGGDTVLGDLGTDTLTTNLGVDTLTGGSGADKFAAGGGNDTINARNEDVDTSFSCGEHTGDSDKVNADLQPADPVNASATNCEVVNKL